MGRAGESHADAMIDDPVPMAQIPEAIERMDRAELDVAWVALVIDAVVSDTDWSVRTLCLALAAIRDRLGVSDAIDRGVGERPIPRKGRRSLDHCPLLPIIRSLALGEWIAVPNAWPQYVVRHRVARVTDEGIGGLDQYRADDGRIVVYRAPCTAQTVPQRSPRPPRCLEIDSNPRHAASRPGDESRVDA